MGTAIEISDLSKRFQLYHDRRNSLREKFLRKPTKRYDDFWALRDIDFEVPEGSCFGLIGHNGSGKSTLLKMMAGIYRPTSGSVVTHGRVGALLELGAGFHLDLTGRENVYLNGALLGLSRKQIAAQFDEIVEFSGLSEFIDSPVKVYSSGMIVRLGFSVAVHVEPQILLVDEIIAVGDEEFQRKCLDHLFQMRRRGTTIVLVSHALSTMRNMCESGVWLDHGRQRMVGDIGAITEAYLDEVDAKEVAKSHVDTDAATGSRSGSGEVRITSIDWLDHAGLPQASARSGESLTIRINYEAAEDISEADVTIMLTHEAGVVASVASTSHALQPIAMPAGAGSVDLAVRNLPLEPANYLVSTSISSRGHVFDQLRNEFELHVRPGIHPPTGGLVRLDAQWSAD